MNTKTTCAALAAALLSACTGGANGNGSNSADSKVASPKSLRSDAPTTQPTAGPATPLGQAATAGGVQFTVTKVATPAIVGGGGSASTTMPGETFVVVDYTLKNVGGEPLLYLHRPAIKLLDGRGRAYAADDSATTKVSIVFGEDSSGATADLNPNVSARTRGAWKVDKAAFDRGTWRLAIGTQPQLAFALK